MYCKFIGISASYPRRRQSRGRVFTSICLFLCTMSHKIDSAEVTKLGIEMSQNDSWKFIYFGSEGHSKVKFMSHKNHCQRGSLRSCECWLILHCVSKKRPTFKLSVTLSNLSRFSTFVLLESIWILVQDPHDITHLTLDMLLHYLGKLTI